MSAILKFDFQKRKQLRFSEVNYLNYIKKTQFACGNYISLKQGETRTSHGPIPHPLKQLNVIRSFQRRQNLHLRCLCLLVDTDGKKMLPEAVSILFLFTFLFNRQTENIFFRSKFYTTTFSTNNMVFGKCSRFLHALQVRLLLGIESSAVVKHVEHIGRQKTERMR